MQVIKLGNGLTIIMQKTHTKSVALEIMVKTGSNNETKGLGGISHFIEHMLFEGTKNRSATKIANEIEKNGGDFNAYTSTERTAFYVSILKRHFDIALDVLSDMLKNSLFDEKAIKKEKKVILDEVKLINDQPRFYQWVLFSKALFKEHPAKNPTYGTMESVRKVGRKDLMDYYSKHYVPNNIIVSIVGNIGGILPKVKREFSTLPKKSPPKKKMPREPGNKRTKRAITKQTLQSYVILGYKTPKRADKDSYVLDVIRAILGRGQSGKLFEEIRQKRGLAYEVGVHHEANADYGFFAVYLSTHKKNIGVCIELIMQEFKKLQNLGNKELREAKNFLEGEFHLRNEDNVKFADLLAFFESAGGAKMSQEYIKNINKITKEDVKRAARKYLNQNYTLTLIKQK